MAAYHRPESLTNALNILAQQPAKIVAGCTDVFAATQAPALNGLVLDITGIDALRGIRVSRDYIHIGAATTWSDVIAANLPPAFDMLKQAAREVGSVQIQTSATIAGNICNASPAADGVPGLLALDAEIELRSRSQTRIAPLSAFLTGARQTILRPDELVTGIRIPASAAAGISLFEKLGARKFLVISIAMVATRLVVQEERVTQASIAVGACSAVATRLHDLEQALTNQTADETLAVRATQALIEPALAPIEDIRADASYRVRAAVTLVQQSLHRLTTDQRAATP